MKKRILALSLSLAMSISLFSACGGTETPEASGSDPEASQSSDGGTSAAALNIGIVTSPSGVDDGSFNQDNYNGILEFITNNPSSEVTAIREGNMDNSIPTVEGLVADYDVIVTPGFQFAGISQSASDNPDKKFILVDAFPSPVGDVEVFENIYAMTFAEEESGFFAGIAAALETKTNKVAVVNGAAFPSNINYQYGFQSGVAYANAKFGTAVECIALASYAGTDTEGNVVGGNYVGTFDDEARGKMIGEALLAEGCDIIFVAAGGSGNGVFTAVKEHGKSLVIGCDVDQYKDGENGSENIILTSALKVMGPNVTRVLGEIAAGTFVGENVVLGAATDSTGYVSEDGHHQMSAETLEKLEEAYAELKAGNVTPASAFNGHSSEDFPGLA